jgi:hypothetical protein
MRRRRAYDRPMRSTIALVVALLAAACTSFPGGSPSASAPEDLPGSSASPGSTNPPDLTMPPDVSVPPELGDIPEELYAQAAAEAAAAANASIDQVELVRGERVTWSDGSLGCPEPGQMYTQALVPGFWLILRVGEQEFDFRASEQGQLKLCAPGQGLPPIEDS